MRWVFAIAAAALLSAFAPANETPPRAEAYFAMGCFWCAEHDMEAVPGVIEAVSGYTGGTTRNPTYKQVSAGGTGHYEAVRVIYDPSKVKYSQLLDVFWKNVDPFDPVGQFCDKGESYRAAIFVRNAAQRKLAEASKARVESRLGKRVATKILDKRAFYDAEGYHQDYADNNPVRYRFYRRGCGRDARLKQVWGS
ncbi:MAG: peptide-methionine (S)-S-oxide reductase [Erythrobacter sp. RIFCSPHIGHO2_12_FULL_63_10]|nr:MAG: peptide-methionine (S)-S-oxide reductase [Erythrobacter sp. RIFCSPHIGHO2_12_FULL_63_10]